MQKKVFLVDGRRTPFGKFGGTLKQESPVDLAAYLAKELIKMHSLGPKDIDQVILGNVIPSTSDCLYGGRHLALKSGLDQATPGLTLNRLCGSGIQVIADGLLQIQSDRANCVLAAGTENMSLTPHLMYGSRFGTKYGNLQTVDLLLDALTDKFAGIPMGITAENLAKEYAISREQCDEFAYQSHFRATEAWKSGHFKSEVLTYSTKKQDISQDEHLRAETTVSALSQLRPSFDKSGVVTAGNASGVVDGAAVTILAGEDWVKEHQSNPLAEIVDFAVVGVDPKIMGIGPVPAIQKLCQKNSLKLSDISILEINEAFAPQTLACLKALEYPAEQCNRWGGAIALGHPLAASGTRIALTAARQFEYVDSDYAIASACIGGGQGIAILLRRVKN